MVHNPVRINHLLQSLSPRRSKISPLKARAVALQRVVMMNEPKERVEVRRGVRKGEIKEGKRALQVLVRAVKARVIPAVSQVLNLVEAEKEKTKREIRKGLSATRKKINRGHGNLILKGIRRPLL